MKTKTLIAVFVCLLFTNCLFAQRGDVYQRSKEYEPPTDSLVLNKLSRWQDLKFRAFYRLTVEAAPRHGKVDRCPAGG